MQKKAILFIWNYLKNYKAVMFLVIISILLGRGCLQIAMYLLAHLFDYAASNPISSEYWNHILWVLLGCFGIDILSLSFECVGMWLPARIFPHIRSVIIKDVFDYVNKHSISYFTNEMTGNISNKFNQLQSGVIEFLTQINNTIFQICFLIVNLVMLSWVNWILGLSVFIWSVIIFFIGKYFGKKRAHLSKQTSTRQSYANAMIVDSIANYSEIKSFANYHFERINLLKNLRIWRHTEKKEQNGKISIGICLHLISSFSGLFFMLLSLGLFYLEKIDLTAFIFVLTTMNYLSGMIYGVNWSVNNLSRINGQIDSALSTLAVEPEIIDSPQAQTINTKSAGISFENVNFAYNQNKPILKDFNLNIKAGEKVGIVGSSGAGKSTLIKLISRYFDVDSGKIKINDINIKDVTQDSLHKIIGTIPQDVCLFNRTLKDNIRYGNPEADDKRLINAAKSAFADKFIELLPAKYDTKVGDRGVILSGGERQRIAIARVILKNAPILIFDEATSSLDSESEKYIQDSLKSLMQNKTVVAIAHRLSTLREMDRILVMENGKIVEEGTHLSLLRKKGRYANLFKIQSDGFIK